MSHIVDRITLSKADEQTRTFRSNLPISNDDHDYACAWKLADSTDRRRSPPDCYLRLVSCWLHELDGRVSEVTFGHTHTHTRSVKVTFQNGTVQTLCTRPNLMQNRWWWKCVCVDEIDEIELMIASTLNQFYCWTRCAHCQFLSLTIWENCCVCNSKT